MLTRPVFYDQRMATAKVWFSQEGDVRYRNVFAGDGKSKEWSVGSWHEDDFSIPVPSALEIPREFVQSSGLSWPEEGDDPVYLIMNIAVVPGSSKSTLDKFKLYGVESC